MSYKGEGCISMHLGVGGLVRCLRARARDRISWEQSTGAQPRPTEEDLMLGGGVKPRYRR